MSPGERLIFFDACDRSRRPGEKLNNTFNINQVILTNHYLTEIK